MTKSGSPASVGTAARGIALVASGWGSFNLLWVAVRQIDVAGILQGDIPLGIAFRIGGDVLPFLFLLLLPCLVSLVVAIRRDSHPIWGASIWTITGFILAYGVYLARFSVGPLLIPSAALMLLAGLLAFWLSLSGKRTT